MINVIADFLDKALIREVVPGQVIIALRVSIPEKPLKSSAAFIMAFQLHAPLVCLSYPC